MTGPARSLVLVALALAVPGCGGKPAPRRVPDDGAPCSAIMPRASKSDERTFRLESVTVTERAWGVTTPDLSDERPKETMYFVRRSSVPPGAPLRDAALLDAAAARVARGIALQDGTKPTIAKVATEAGEAIELRWPINKLPSATRLFLIPGGFCEVSIWGAYTEAEVDSYLASAQVRPDGRN